MKKEQFHIPSHQIYLAGHSLGPMSHLAFENVQLMLNQWKKHGVKTWNTDLWMAMSNRIAKQIATLVNADPNEVILSDSTTVNLYKVLKSALGLNPKRSTILSDSRNFPADLYIAQGIAGHDNSISVKTVNKETIVEHLTDEIAVLMLTHVDYLDSSMYDMPYITQRAHEKGIMVVFDLSHSIGIVPLDLRACNVDFAVGCTYKYLNGGPGSPAFIYINRKHHDTCQSPILGWMGHADPFSFSKKYQAKTGIEQFVGGTPYILSLSSLEGAMSLFTDVNMIEHHRMSLALSNRLRAKLSDTPLTCITPDNSNRGGHIAFAHHNAQSITQELIRRGVICDYRPNNIIRFGINPLYVDMDDIEHVIHSILNIIEDTNHG